MSLFFFCRSPSWVLPCWFHWESPKQILSFRCGLSQEDILCYRLPDDPETMFTTRDSVAEAPQAQFRIFPENPLGMGFYIACINNGKFLCSRLRYSVHENGSFNIFNWSVHVYQIAIEEYMCIKLHLKCTCVSSCNWSEHVYQIAFEVYMCIKLQLKCTCVSNCNWSVHVYQIAIEVYMCVKLQLKCTCVSNCNWSIHHTLPVIGNETFELFQGYDYATGAIHYKQPGKGAYTCTYLFWVLDMIITYSSISRWHISSVDGLLFIPRRQESRTCVCCT